MDFGITTIHHWESVADLRAARDVSEVVNPIGKDQRNPVGGSRPGGRREAQREAKYKQERSHRGHSLPREPGQRFPWSRQIGMMIPQTSAAVSPLVTGFAVFWRILEPVKWIVPAVRAAVEPDS